MSVELNIFGTIGGFDSENKDSVKAALVAAGGQDITINVSSSGGDVFEGLSIAGLISQYGGKTVGRGIGIVASAATLILLAAKEKKMVKNSFFMLHNSWGGATGNAAEMERSVELLKKVDEQMAEIYTAQIESKGKLIDGDRVKTLAKVKKMMEAETWLTPEEATEIGLIDGVIEEEKQYEAIYEETFAQIRAEANNFKNIPKKIVTMAAEKKSILQQIAALFGLNAEFKEEEIPSLNAAAEEKKEEAVSEEQVKEEKSPEAKTDVKSKEQELEEKLAKIQKQIDSKQAELETIEAEIKAKINYKSEPKAEQKVEVGFTQEQIAQASAFINSLIQK